MIATIPDRTLPALQLARTPRSIRRGAWAVLVILFLLVPALGFTPWTQTIHGMGQAIAFNPVQRPQFVISPIEGRVEKWHVVEGDRVKAGQLLVELVDNDPMILERLREQLLLAEQRLTLAVGRVNDIERRLQTVTDLKPVLVAQATAKIGEAEQAVLVAKQKLIQAKSDRTREELAYTRADRLYKSDLGKLESKDAVEEAKRKLDLAIAKVPLAQAEVDLAEKTLEAVTAAKDATEKSTDAAIQSEEAALKSARGEEAAVKQQYKQMETLVERQSNQRIYAAVDGIIFRILANAEAGGQLVKAGERLAVLTPDVRPTKGFPKDATLGAVVGGPGLAADPVLTADDHPGIVAELSIDGNDLPLVRIGDRVILQFEGWAAVQFAAYPEAAAGTFEGRVYLVDPTANEAGNFRILVEPAPGAEWPDEKFLRQGVRAQGWVLLNRVTVGYEVWRLLNGFPPARPVKQTDSANMLGPVGVK